MEHPRLSVVPGETLAGKYRVERILGRGGMCVVLGARHLELEERVAIKVLATPRESMTPSLVDRFLREARTSARLKSDHVCRVFDVGRTDEGDPYIVMELLEGTDLAKKLETEGPQPFSRVAGWILEVCDALVEAHGLGIVHRDLKPANLFLVARPDGSLRTKVLDFGISKLGSATTLTAPAAIIGSPSYMSPEQIEAAHDVDGRSDIWSLGVVMYELLSGKTPFEGERMVQLAVQIREKPHAPLRDVPRALTAVIDRCLAKDPAARYEDVRALAKAIAPFAPMEFSTLAARIERSAMPAFATEKASSERRWRVALPALLGALALGGGYAVLGRARTTREESPANLERSAEPAVTATSVPTPSRREASPSEVASAAAPTTRAPVRGTTPRAAVSAKRTPLLPTDLTVPIASSSADVPKAPPTRKPRDLDRSDP
jgi:eukaryotic-like serine/threonine-protein kinase